MKALLKLVLAAVYLLLAKFVFTDHLSPHLIAESIFIISYFLVDLIFEAYKNRKRLKFLYLTKVLYRNKDIRFSIAYLYRINVDGKYLLVKNRNRPNMYQFVGGVYKTLPGSERIFDKLDVKSDRIIETSHGIAKGDLRVFVKGKNAIEFINWFNSKEDREISPWREFCEELISTGILPPKEFRYIDYKFKGTVESPIITMDSGELGMFIHEIFDFLPNDEQKPILSALQKAGDKKELVWATEYLINRQGHDESKKEYTYDIAPHTKWALNLKWSKG